MVIVTFHGVYISVIHCTYLLGICLLFRSTKGQNQNQVMATLILEGDTYRLPELIVGADEHASMPRDTTFLVCF